MFIWACMFILLEKNSHLYVYSDLYYYSALKSTYLLPALNKICVMVNSFDIHENTNPFYVVSHHTN